MAMIIGKKKHNYGLRWLVEVAFSSFKRRFGESLISKKFENMIKEAKLKVMVYNMITNWPEAGNLLQTYGWEERVMQQSSTYQKQKKHLKTISV